MGYLATYEDGGIIVKSKLKQMDVLERVALGFSVSILIVAGIYWGVQINSVLELLKMAYG
jgi:uncharacterized membrane protein